MLAYVVFWDGTEVGRIYKDADKERYKYLPNCIEIIDLGASMSILGNAQLTWGKMPDFFADRIDKDKECKNYCKCATDKITISKINS